VTASADTIYFQITKGVMNKVEYHSKLDTTFKFLVVCEGLSREFRARGSGAQEEASSSLAMPGWFDFQLLYAVDILLSLTENSLCLSEMIRNICIDAVHKTFL
jgi:hypothetical protein